MRRYASYTSWLSMVLRGPMAIGGRSRPDTPRDQHSVHPDSRTRQRRAIASAPRGVHLHGRGRYRWLRRQLPAELQPPQSAGVIDFSQVIALSGGPGDAESAGDGPMLLIGGPSRPVRSSSQDGLVTVQTCTASSRRSDVPDCEPHELVGIVVAPTSRLSPFLQGRRGLVRVDRPGHLDHPDRRRDPATSPPCRLRRGPSSTRRRCCSAPGVKAVGRLRLHDHRAAPRSLVRPSGPDRHDAQGWINDDASEPGAGSTGSRAIDLAADTVKLAGDRSADPGDYPSSRQRCAKAASAASDNAGPRRPVPGADRVEKYDRRNSVEGSSRSGSTRRASSGTRTSPIEGTAGRRPGAKIAR